MTDPNAIGAFDGMASPTAKKRGGKKSRNKGLRGERELVNRFIAAGIHSERVPLSGAAGGSYTGDLTVAVQGQDWTGESKWRADGFKQLYAWLAANRLLFLRADHQPTLVCLRLDDFIQIIGAAKSSRPRTRSKQK